MADKINQRLRQIATKMQPAAILCLKLLLLFTLIKCIFYFYNLNSGQGWHVTGLPNLLHILFWSLWYDLFIIATLLLIPVLTLWIIHAFPKIRKLVISLTILMMAGVCTLNLADAFYYPFKLQRS